MTIWLLWFCQCDDINVQAHPYIRVKVNINAWIGYWLHPYSHTSDHHHPQIVWTGAGKCLDESSAKPTSCDNLISVTLPMWWYQHPGTSIHQSHSQHQCMNRLLAASIMPDWIITILKWCGLVQVNVLMNCLPSPPIVTIWLQWLCQCGDINVQAHPYIRVNIDISAWIGYWLHPYRQIGSSPSSNCVD